MLLVDSTHFRGFEIVSRVALGSRRSPPTCHQTPDDSEMCSKTAKDVNYRTELCLVHVHARRRRGPPTHGEARPIIKRDRGCTQCPGVGGARWYAMVSHADSANSAASGAEPHPSPEQAGRASTMRAIMVSSPVRGWAAARAGAWLAPARAPAPAWASPWRSSAAARRRRRARGAEARAARAPAATGGGGRVRDRIKGRVRVKGER